MHVYSAAAVKQIAFIIFWIVLKDKQKVKEMNKEADPFTPRGMLPHLPELLSIVGYSQ